VRRGKEIVADSSVISLKRFKDDAKEVAAGYECGVGVKDFNDFQVGDVLEFYRMEKSGT
jgi:translation initiation factor IF-2